MRDEKSPVARRTGYQALRTRHGFSEYALSAFGTELKNRLWRDHLGAHEPQTLAKRVFAALEQYCFKQRGKPRFKGRQRPLHSLEGKSSASAIRYQVEAGCLRWKDLLLPVMLPPQGRDPYLDEAMTRKVKFARVLWRTIQGKVRYFAQLVMEGQPPATVISQDAVGGLDIGPSTVASVSPQGAALHRFCSGVEPCAKTLRRLQRQADRSLRATNPHCFDEQGRWIRGQRITERSSRLIGIRKRIAETERVLQARRQNEHGQRVNALLTQANTWKTEQLSYHAFQKCFGRSVKNRAPGYFIHHLTRKAESAGGKVIELNTRGLKMSQYDHCTGSYRRKPLSLRWHSLGDGSGLIQRDVYSALLACCVEGDVHSPSRIHAMLAAQESALRHAGLWKTQSASGVAVATPTVKAVGADGMSKREGAQLQPSKIGNPV